MNIIIIGTSPIIEHHIKCFKYLKFNILAICTTNKLSSNHINLKNKYKIKYAFNDVKKLFNFANKYKDFSFLIAPRIKDIEKIILKCAKYKKKIFVEKPLTDNLNFFKKINKYKKKIFVGYNRIFYENVNFLYKKIYNKKNLFIDVSCAEDSKKDILSNTCHIISILLKIFKDIKILNILRNKNFIFVTAQTSRKNLLIIKLNFKATENFEIKIIDKKIVYHLKPIEKLTIYKNLEKVSVNKINYYNPKKNKEINEFKMNNYKPGFLNQAKMFKNFIKYDKKIINNIDFSKKVIEITNKIYGKK